MACARPVPNAAVPPVLDRLPATRAVSGVPVFAVKVPRKDQPVSALVFHPLLRMHAMHTHGRGEEESQAADLWR